MPAIDFPNSPAVNDTFTSGSNTWKWNGTVWNLMPNTVVGPQGNRNVMVNGDLAIWQRGAGNFTTNGAYAADRWRVSLTGSSSTVSQQAFTIGNPITGLEPRYYIRSVTTTSAGAGNFSQLYNQVESVRTMAGKTVTLSFYAKADASKNIAVELLQNFGTGGSPSASVSGIGSQLVGLTSSWTRYSVTISVPAITGKTLGTNDNDGLLVIFWFDAGSNFNTRAASLGQQSGTFDIWGLQLEEGSTLTDFERVPIADQLARCQRYYYRISQPSGAGVTVFASGHAVSTTGALAAIHFPTTMRAAPTMGTTGTAGNYDVRNAAGTGVACSAVPTMPNSTTSGGQMSFTVASGLVAGNATTMDFVASANAWLEFVAELG